MALVIMRRSGESIFIIDPATKKQIGEIVVECRPNTGRVYMCLHGLREEVTYLRRELTEARAETKPKLELESEPRMNGSGRGNGLNAQFITKIERKKAKFGKNGKNGKKELAAEPPPPPQAKTDPPEPPEPAAKWSPLASRIVAVKSKLPERKKGA